MIKDSATTILCYGDSNTWGNVPRSNDRHPRSVRWPGALQQILGDSYEVISEGLPGRTFVAVEPGKTHRTGITHLQAIIESADPVDIMTIMLGTNDVKTTFGLSATDIAGHLEQTVSFIQKGKSDLEKIPKILIICPPTIVMPSDGNLDPRMTNGVQLTSELPALYKAVAEKHGCAFINAQDHISSSVVDGYHLDAESHLKLAKVIADHIKALAV